MAVMYVDDSGSASYNDHTGHFVLSGVMVDDSKIKDLQRTVFEYKQSNFEGAFVDAEIHVHDMYKSRGDFKMVDHTERINLLNKLYEMISGLDFAGISVVIDKATFQNRTPTASVLSTAWMFLLERYGMFLEEKQIDAGYLRIDRSSNKVQNRIVEIVHRFTYTGTRYQSMSRIRHPIFADSSGVYGIQVADALAYCTSQHKIHPNKFGKYWDMVYPKLQTNRHGKIEGYGYKEYP